MFTPRAAGSRARASPYTPGSQRTQNKRTSGVFTPQKRRLSSLSQNLTLRSNTPSKSSRHLQTSQIIDDASSHYRVESFGVPLPVLITEALTLADKNTEITVNIDDSGWAWLVGGRKLFVWRYKPQIGSRGVQCKELTLPASDLAHSAERVCVLSSPGDQQPAACVAVSPEGVVRYWPNIAYESSTGEVSAELKGEECACVINFQPFGCLLATTTSSLVLLLTTPGQTTVICQPLKSAQGMFAGIGRRMSSFIFGASPMQSMGAVLQAIVAGDEDEDEESRPFFVLSGTHMQKWELTNVGPEKLIYQVDISRMFREELARKIWDMDAVQMPHFQTWLIDMKTTSDGVIILGAGVNLDADSIVHFALASVLTDDMDPPYELEDLIPLEHSQKYQEDSEMDILSYRLLVPDNKTVYIYDKREIIAKQLADSVCDTLKLQSMGDQILGGGNCSATAVFFSSNHGLFCLSSASKTEHSILEESGHEALSRLEVPSLATSKPQIAEMSMSEDRSTRFKASFIHHLKGNSSESQKLVEELFPHLNTNESETSELDQLVIVLSHDLIDDYPASDPRWAESIRTDSSGNISSLIILQQLKDKDKAHEYFINFLKKLNLWDRLKAVPIRDTVMSTRLHLCEMAEKVSACIGLREIHTEQSSILDSCIRRVLESVRDGNIPAGLTTSDVFYREVSKIDDILSALLEYEDQKLASNLSPKENSIVVSSINSILEAMMYSALQYRQSKAAMFQGVGEGGSDLEYIPWTSSGGNNGIRTMLTRQYMLTIESAIPDVSDVEARGVLFQQLMSMADVLLDGYQSQLVSLQQCAGKQDLYTQLLRKYEQERDRLISPLMKHEQYERAATLAEKYFDFKNLIKICETTKNQDRLQRYTAQFADKGFSNFLFNWCVQEGKQGRLLSQPIGSDADLKEFLNSDNTKYLSWLHDINMKNFHNAHHTLTELAQAETTFLAKKKTLLSLSKLAALACDEPIEQIEGATEVINEELNLISHQEQIPSHVFERLSIDPMNMNVMSVQEIIELCIGDNNQSPTEFDFKKALDLLHYIDKSQDECVDELRLHIWSRALLQDDWTHSKDADPLDIIKETVFFKTIDLAYTEGAELSELLPSLEEIQNTPQIGILRHNSHFKYLVGVGYEHMHNVMS